MSELLRVETERVVLTWSAAGGREPAPLPGTTPPPGRVEVEPLRPGARVRGPALPAARLFEQTEYAVVVQSAGGGPVALEHRDPVLLRGLRPLDGGRIVHGTVDFGSQVGVSRFTVRVGGEPELALAVEVFPTKLDYALDYERLLADVEEILRGLAVEYLRPTTRAGGPAAAPGGSSLEWVLLLRHQAGELERALGQVAGRPVRGLSRDPQESRAERVTRPDAALRRAVGRGAGAGPGVRLAEGLPVRERLHERRARPTLDTPEHRWLAARLEHLRRRLGRVRREEARRAGGERGAAVLAELGALEERVARLSRLEPLAAATRPPPPGFASLQLLSAPGYGEAYRACLALERGLGVEGGPLELPVKELHLLYEYWCYLTVVRLLAEAAGVPVPAAQLLAAEPHGLRVRLRRGTEHAVVLNAPGGRRVTATYNPSFHGGALLVPQRPDVLLGVHDPGRPARFAVLDAKYRLDAAPGYLRRYGAPGPPEEALNDLHRYRDAITRPGGGAGAAPERLVARAAALFPYREAEPGAFRASHLWGSLERLGVGAIPLLPGSTGYLAEWLGELLAPAP